MRNNPNETTPSGISQKFTDFGNAIKDAYGHVIHGDDAGAYETFVFIARPQPVSHYDSYAEKYDLGMTFIEVNGRAFVNYVVPNSDAHRAGVRPQDCLQLATSLEWVLEREGSHCDDECMENALDCEKNGMRTSFDDLKEMFEHCSLNSSNEDLFSSSRDNFPQKKSLTQKLRYINQEVVGRCATFSFHNVCSSISQVIPTEQQYPIFMVFRHTQSRQRTAGNTHVGLPSFRLDDECKRAASIMRQLAPTPDTIHEDDAWDEIANHASSIKKINYSQSEREITPEDLETVEASTIRSMIKDAVGLAFVRASKVVLGLSFHFGSGIVISRLEDRSWSAPSAIGMYGAGLGFQFGLEVADYIFVIQTNEAMNHFRNGTSYTIGGNMGAAVGGNGREAFGAASVSVKDDGTGRGNVKEGNALNVAPIIAYAKSQGLYIGVSLEGSKIFVREDINHRTYHFLTGKKCSTEEILSGKVKVPNEAEDLHATLYNVEFAHKISQLPRTPIVLHSDLHTDWRFDTIVL